MAPQGIPSPLALEIPAVGRPRIPKDLRRLIQEMAAENPTWGEERIANELNRKLTIRISPRPVRTPDPQQRWLTLTATMPRSWWPATSSW